MLIALEAGSEWPATGSRGLEATDPSRGEMEEFKVLMQSGTADANAEGTNVVEQYGKSMAGSLSRWREEWSSLGTSLRLDDNASVVRVLNFQASMSLRSVEFQFGLQLADTARHSVKALYQQQA